jgi:hypothetical protein
VKICLGLFSAAFGQNRTISGHKFFPAKQYFLEPVLSYFAESLAIWQQWSRQGLIFAR